MADTVYCSKSDNPGSVRDKVISAMRAACPAEDVRVFAFETCDLPSVATIARYALDYGITVAFAEEQQTSPQQPDERAASALALMRREGLLLASCIAGKPYPLDDAATIALLRLLFAA